MPSPHQLISGARPCSPWMLNSPSKPRSSLELCEIAESRRTSPESSSSYSLPLLKYGCLHRSPLSNAHIPISGRARHGSARPTTETNPCPSILVATLKIDCSSSSLAYLCRSPFCHNS
ncbi:hypothetical protein L484_005195 [Morus notabilis]|uniref:Uncharacterized protein n=1 Tax=Morus notabilis TaxID=981085 RepID=W9R932_9ROSA|nr:hypothetical protein L484_005195 [Morus notabilis]